MRRTGRLLVIAVVPVVLMGSGSPLSADIEENEATIQRFVSQFWNRGEYGLLDELAAPDFQHHEADGITRDRQGYRELLEGYAAFPDGVFSVQDTVASGDRVAIRWVWTGTHQGDFRGIPPTGKRLALPGQTVFRLADGRIAEMWSAWNMLDLMQQLGFTLTPPQGGEVR